MESMLWKHSTLPAKKFEENCEHEEGDGNNLSACTHNHSR
jgi:hypothetical protein